MPEHHSIADVTFAGIQVHARVEHHVRNGVDLLAMIRLHFHVVQQIHAMQRMIQARNLRRQKQPSAG